MNTENKSKRKKALIWFFRILAVLVLLILLIGFLFTLPPGEKLIRNFTEKQLQNLTGQQVEIGRLETNLVSRIQIWNLRIFQTQKDSIVPFVDLKYGRINYLLLALLKKDLSIQALSLDSLQVNVIQDSSGFLNLPQTGSSADTIVAADDSSASGFQVILEEARITHTAITFDDRTIPLEGSLNQLAMKVEGGSSGAYRFFVQADSGGMMYRKDVVPLQRFRLEGSWESQILKIDSTDLTIPGLRLTGNSRINLQQSPAAMSGELTLNGNLQALADIFREQMPASVYPLDAFVDAIISFDGNLEKPIVRGTVKFPRVRTPDLALDQGLLEFEYQTEYVSISKIELPVFSGKIAGTGQLHLDSLLHHQFTLTIQNLDFQKIWRTVYTDSSDFSGTLNGKILSDGPLLLPESLQADARLTITKARYQSKIIPDYKAALVVKKGIARLNLNQSESEIRATLQLKDEQLTGDYSVDIKKLNPFASLFGIEDLTGTVKVAGKVRGPLESPEVRADVTAGNIVYQNFPLDRLEGLFVYRDKNIQLKNIRFSGKLAAVDTLNPPLQFAGLSGGFSYEGRVTGALDSLEAELSVDLNEPAYREFRFRKGSLEASLNKEKINIKSFQLSKDSVTINLTGEYAFATRNGSGQLALFSPGGSLDTEPKIKPELPLPEADSIRNVPEFGEVITRFDLSDSSDWQITAAGKLLDLERVGHLYPLEQKFGGQMKFDLSVSGLPRKPSGSLNFTIREARLNQVTLDSVAGDMQVRNDRFYLDSLNVFLKGNKSFARGQVDLSESPGAGYTVSSESGIQGTAKGENISLKLFEPFLGPEARLEGIASYQLSWKGTIGKPSVRGNFSLSGGNVRLSPLSAPVDSLQARLTLNDSLINFEKLSGKIRQTPFDLTGRVVAENWQIFRSDLNLRVAGLDVIKSQGIISAESLDLRVTITDFQLSPLQAFLPEVKSLDGVLNSNLSIGGNFNAPDLRGNLNIRKLAVQHKMLEERITNGVVKVGFDNNKIKLDSLYFKIKEGIFYASGNLIYSNSKLTDMNMKAHAEKIKIEKPDKFKLSIKTADLSYRTRDNAYHLEGDIILGESTLMYNLEPKEILSSFQSVERPIREPPEIMQKTRLDVRLRESENIWIDNNLAHLRLHSELAFIGTLANPNISGRLIVEEGYVLYLDRKFQVEKGVLDFVNPNKLNPIVNLNTRATVKDYQGLESQEYIITLTVSGPLDEATIDLSSQPALSRTDILSLLTFGATQQQLTGSGKEGTTVTDVLRQRVESLSSGRISGYVSRKVGNLLGLEEMRISGNIFNVNNATGPQLVASKKISDRVKLTYSTTVGHLNEQSIRLNYQLSDHFSVQGQTNQQGRSGVDLKYRVKFK